MRCFKMKCFVVSMVVAGLAIMVFTATAGASPIRFDNPAGDGHFEWYTTTPDAITLAITSDAASQPVGIGGGIGPFLQYHNGIAYVQGAQNDNSHGELQFGGPYNDMVVGVDFGDPIPSGSVWGVIGYIYFPGDPFELPEGVETYLGVRFTMEAGGDWHHGWIGVVRDDIYLDAFAWGYETDVGVPIAAGVPEPGTLALLATGLAGLLCYAWRKRK